ncbi:hypothetical protein [Carnobacterium sp. FSL W8-0810]|uniref:hypothetical protein n=1 Tax=Carnobacterium sp. FSL W8-0810 TaxID=2954705 RepID=UPI0030F5A14A
MKELVLILAAIVNEIHDTLNQLFGMNMSDKDLHFWVMGIIGIIFFIGVYILFKIVGKWKFSTTILSFIYTFTMMTVLVFAIEIQQAITNRGNMEFADAAVGLWGFIVFFAVYVVVVGVIYTIYSHIRKKKIKKVSKKSVEEQALMPEKPIEEPIKEPVVYRSQVKNKNKFKK